MAMQSTTIVGVEPRSRDISGDLLNGLGLDGGDPLPTGILLREFHRSATIAGVIADAHDDPDSTLARGSVWELGAVDTGTGDLRNGTG
jgi:hypothetical protein